MANRHTQALVVAQIEVDWAEAAGSWFQAWWRLFCGYVCVLGLAEMRSWEKSKRIAK